MQFVKGERVRVDIPDETNPDHEEYHGSHGTVIEVLNDAPDKISGGGLDAKVYRIELDDGETIKCWSANIRPPIDYKP